MRDGMRPWAGWATASTETVFGASAWTGRKKSDAASSKLRTETSKPRTDHSWMVHPKQWYLKWTYTNVAKTKVHLRNNACLPACISDVIYACSVSIFILFTHLFVYYHLLVHFRASEGDRAYRRLLVVAGVSGGQHTVAGSPNPRQRECVCYIFRVSI